MNTPTNDDLKRMVDEAPRHATKNDESLAAEDKLKRASGILNFILRNWANADESWTNVWSALLRVIHLCALVAWEVGKRMTPQDVPASAETPDAKTGVEALLVEYDAWRNGRLMHMVAPDLCNRLAAAFRAERERAERATEAAGLTYTRAFDLQEHLRAVLRTGWAHSAMAPSVVQKARAFLEDPSAEQPMGPNRTRYALRCADLRAREAETERDVLRAKLAAEDEAHGYTRADLAAARRDIEAARRDRDAAVDQTASCRAENLDLRKVNLELVQRVEGLENGIRGLAAHVPAKGDA